MPVSLEDQIRCVKREIGMRKRVYPHWVESSPTHSFVKSCPAPTAINLAAAYLCVEPTCETVFDASFQEECPKCGSKAAFPVTRWLNRIPRETRS